MKKNKTYMKKRMYFILTLLLTVFTTTATAATSIIDDGRGPWKMIVLSDVHLMAPQLLVKDGKAYEDYLEGDRKLLTESEEILDSVSERVLRAKPEVVLIAGDLTKDGERVSHDLLAKRYLAVWKKAGIRVFVIPGNHDVNNPHAVEYIGDSARRVATVSADEFAHIYNDYGYGNALARDAHSLSYVAQVIPGLRLLALDACRYDDNSFKDNTCVTAGRLKPETLDFIKEQVAAAKASGEKMIVMMHHGLVPHFSLEKKVLPEYLVEDNDNIAALMSQLGLKVIFTGHLHSNDAASDGEITDVETGSTVSYPSSYRVVSVDDGTMHITTERLESIGSLAKRGIILGDKEKKFAILSVRKMAKEYLPSAAPDEVINAIAKVVGEAYIYNLAGDEHPSEEWGKEKTAVTEGLKKVSPTVGEIIGAIATSLTTYTPPAYNDLTITY